MVRPFVGERLALVVPRCGEDALGGAEVLALAMARDLSERYDVEILSTCAADYWTWENEYSAGISEVAGVRVRRFAVDAPRNLAEFNRLSRRVRFRMAATTIDEQEAWMRAQGPYSSDLLRALAGGTYDSVLFFSYLYATTYFGLPLVGERAILLPLAHDEWPFYFPMWRRFFERVEECIFVSPEERELVQRRFRALPIAGEVVHPRLLELQPSPEPQRAKIANLPECYLLYVGRIDESKGVGELCERFERHAQSHPDSPWRLVLAGPGDPITRQSEYVRYLGGVDEATKRALLQGAGLFVMPSLHESLCIALLEAWAEGCPALVNGWNPVLVGQCRRSNGGLWYRDQESFDASLAALTAETRSILGRQGRAYVTAEYARGDTCEVVGRAMRKTPTIRISTGGSQ